jgi:WG containing repeat
VFIFCPMKFYALPIFLIPGTISCDDKNPSEPQTTAKDFDSMAHSRISTTGLGVEGYEDETGRSEPPDYGLSVPFEESPKSSMFAVPVYGSDNVLRYGFSTEKEKLVIKPKFDLAGNFHAGFAPVIYKGVHGIIDTTGEMVYKLKNYTFSIFQNELSGEESIEGCGEGFFLVKDKNEKFGYVNEKAELVIPCLYDDSQGFSQGRAVIIQNERFGFIDTSGKVIVKPTYELAYSFSDSLACVQIGEKRGFIDLSGKLVIPAIYYGCFYFSEGLCYAKKSENGEALVFKRGKCRIIDKSGTQLRTAGTNCFQGC